MKKSNKRIPKSHLPKYFPGGRTDDIRPSVDNSMYGSPESEGSMMGATQDMGGGTQNIYNEKRSSGNNMGQYAGYAVAAGQTAANLAAINEQDYNGDTKAAYQSQAIGDGITQGMGALSPYIAMGTGIRKSATGMIGDKSGANRTVSNWMAAPHEAASSDIAAANNSENSQSQKIGGYMSAIGDITGMSKMRQMFSYGTGNDEKTTGFWGKYNDLAGISARNNQKNSLEQNQFAFGGMNMQPNTIPQYPTGGTMPRLKPRNFAAEKANYEEATRGANQGDGSGISSAELAYKYSKLIDPTGATSAVEIGKNFYTGNAQDPIDYLGLIRIPFVKQGMKPLSKLAKQGNKASVLNNIITKSNDVAESFSYGGVSQSDVIHAPEMGGYFRKNGGIQYSNGGMSMQPNAEVEGGGYGKDGENTLNPDGTATQFNGPTHEQGGIKTNLDPGTLIFSDKVKWDGKTAADHNKPYTRIIQKATKDLENSSLTKESKLSAHLNLMAATKASQAIFAKQEETKQSRIDSYTKRLGGIMKYPNGGITPQQYKQAQSDSLTLYNSGLKSNIPNFEQNNNYTDAFLRLNDLNKRPPVPTNNVDPYSRTTTATYIKPTMLPYREENFKKGSGIEKIENYAKPVGKPVNHPNYNQFIPGINQSKQPIQTEEFKKGGVKLPKYGNGVKFVPKMASEDQDADIVVPGTRPASKDFTDVLAPDPYNTFGKPLDNWEAARLNKSAWDADYMNNPSAPNPNVTNPDSKNFDWKGLATQSAYFAANNAGNIYDLARADKTETRKYNRATENLVTPNFRDADQKYLYMKNALKGASLGASGYLANLQQSHVNHVLNKAQIQQAADNTNAGIKNQVSQYNTGIANEEILANAKIRANARNIKQSAIASIGSNTANQMNDVRNTNMDKKKMEGLIKMYPSLSKDPKMLEYFMSFNA